jgi:hypothetical protein
VYKNILHQYQKSRQATINVGTIGHVAHGKSTVVKALSGVMVRVFSFSRLLWAVYGAEQESGALLFNWQDMSSKAGGGGIEDMVLCMRDAISNNAVYL